MDVMNLVESFFRWFHVVFGILWIGLLYFFSWVNSSFALTMDGETEKKVIPELMPRALYWFRWGAAFTWITGLLLIGLVYYHTGLLYEFPNTWGPGGVLMVALTWMGVFKYDLLFRAIKNGVVQFFLGWILASVVVLLFYHVGGFSYRGYMIHLGSLFGTIMAFNVWFRIWPAQRKIIEAVKRGETPDEGLLALSRTRSTHNTYMSVPLVFTMIGQHAVGWAPQSPFVLCLVIIFGWWITGMLYRRSQKVRGF
jgi:uncharacterized membrane protein